MDEEAKELPLTPLRIFGEFNGHLRLYPENLQKILSSNKIDGENLVICSVVGARRSGKSFLLNIFIQYLRSQEMEVPNWMGPIQTRKQQLEGFPWFDVPAQQLDQGIYMWPKSFTVTDSNEKDVRVLLMDIVKVNEKTPDYGPLEEAVCLLSSLVVDNHIKEFKPCLLQLLHSIRDFTRTREKPVNFCNCVTFLIRDFNPSSELPCGWGNKAVNYIETILREGDQHDTLKLEYDDLEAPGACLLKVPDSQPVSNGKGLLNLDQKLAMQLKNLCSKFFDSLPTKNFGNRDIQQYFSDVESELYQLQTMRNHNSMLGSPTTVLVQDAMDCDTTGTEDNDETSLGEPTISISLSDEVDLIDFQPDIEMKDLSNESSHNHQNYSPETTVSREEGLISTVSTAPPIIAASPRPQALVNSKISEECLFESQESSFKKTECSTSTSNNNKSVTELLKSALMERSNDVDANHEGSNSTNPISSRNSAYFPIVAETAPLHRDMSILPHNRPQDSSRSSDNKVLKDGFKITSSHTAKLLGANFIPVPPESEDKYNSERHIKHEVSPSISTDSSDHQKYKRLPQELDDKLQTEVQCIRTKYFAAIHEVDNECELQSVHDHEMELATKTLRQFLNNVVDDSNKQQHVKQLEIGLQLELNRKILTIRKTKKGFPISVSSPVNAHVFLSEIKTEGHEDTKSKPQENKASPLPENPHLKQNDANQETQSKPHPAAIEAPKLPMETDDPQSPNPFGCKTLALLMSDYERLMWRYLSPLFIVSDQQLNEGLAKSRKLVFENLAIICRRENMDYGKVKTMFGNIITTREELYRIQTNDKNSKTKELVDSTLTDFRHRIEEAMGRWILEYTDLNLKRKSDYSSIYRTTLSKVLESYNFTERQYYKQFWTLIENGTAETLSIFMELQRSFIAYEAYMNKKFEIYNCCSDDKFKEWHIQGMNSCHKKLSDDGNFLNKHLQAGINNYKRQFQKRNINISAAEKEAAQSVLLPVLNFYHDIMKTLVKITIYSKDGLETLHNKIVEECLTAFKNACDFHSDSGVPSYEKQLKQELDKQIKTHIESNSLKADKIFGTVNKAIENRKKTYNERMDEILPKRGKGMDPLELQKRHEGIFQEQCKLLEMEIRNIDVTVLSSVEKHVQTLREKILGDWDCIIKTNETRMEKEKQKKIEEDREQKKKEAEQKLNEQEHESKKKIEGKKSLANSEQPSSVSEHPKMSVPATTVHKDEESQASDRILPPIAIEFGLHNIRVGWMIHEDKFEMISNSWGEKETLNQVALTLENEVLIGEEVESRPKSLMKFYFKLEEVLNDPRDHEEVHECNLDEDRYLRKEFLIGLVLARIKLDTEKQLRGKWTTAVITVPLWYTSIQRQATKDAAIIAGFSEVHLLNETSAAALAMSMSATGENRCSARFNKYILVTVASDFHFDTAVYNYGSGNVEMESSRGDLHCHTPPLLFKTIKSVKKFFGFQSPSTLDFIFKDLVGVKKDQIKKSVFIDAGNPKGRPEYYEPLKNFTSKYGEPYDRNRAAELIITGTAIFARCLHSSGESIAKALIKDKATYTFQRRVGKITKTLFQSYQTLVSTEVQDTQTIGVKSYGGASGVPISIPVEEVSGENVFPVGELQVKVEESSVLEFQVKVFLNYESIFRAEAYLSDGKGKDKEIRPLPLKFRMPLLSDVQKGKYASLVESLKSDEKKEALERSKKDLETLVKEIEPKVPFVKRMIGKDQLEKTVGEAIAVVQHPKSTQEMVDIKIEILTRLKSKYITDN